MTTPPADAGALSSAQLATVTAAAQAAYVERQQLARRAVLAVRQLWAQTDPSNIRQSWAAGVGSRITSLVAAAQLQAASVADRNIASLLLAQAITTQPVAAVYPAAFAGIASDGRPLESLLELSNRYALRLISTGTHVDTALADAGTWLEFAAGLQVVDAGRVADGVALTAARTVQGYVRMLTLPSCARCIVLAGKFYRWNTGFLRHPRCDCRHVPTAEDVAGDLRTDPAAVFESLSASDQDQIFTKAGAQAIRDGADMGQVVNARQGMAPASVGTRPIAVTTVGRKHRHGGVRLMPEQIYHDAAGDRDMALRLLKRFGYLA